MRRLSILIPLVLVTFTAFQATAALNQWSSSGPYATGLANRTITAVAVTADGRTVYAATGSGSAFSYGYGYQLLVTIPPSGTGVGNGQVASDTGGISCSSGNSGSCIATYLYGDPVTLTVATQTGSTFSNWTQDCSSFGVASCILSMTTDKNATAQFGLGPNGTGPMAKILATGYNSVSDAYSAAGLNDSILAKAGPHVLGGTFLMNQAKNIILKGGYNPDFSKATVVPTTLQGGLQINSGSLRTENIKMK
jgi:hypothetical protein